MHRIDGYRRSYDWGSPTAMFSFLGLQPDGSPFAENWFGAHPTGPSPVALPDGSTVSLQELIAADPTAALGTRVAASFGKRLPFLLKLLAPARPLSMQVHPTPEQARDGYAAEEENGVPPDDPARSYKDASHKPEMVYALTRFEGLVGFRPADQLSTVLEPLQAAGARAALTALRSAPVAAGRRAALEVLLELSPAEVVSLVRECAVFANDSHRRATVPPATAAAYTTVTELARFYPGDVGAVLSLLLNRVVLEPGQLVFLGDGVPHAYLSGFGVELMANSDNVLRLGLTTKHVDADAMLVSLDFAQEGCVIDTGTAAGGSHLFTPDVTEYALSVTHVDDARSRSGSESVENAAATFGMLPVELPGNGPRLVLCVAGTTRLKSEADPAGLDLRRGQAAFVPAADGALSLSGSGTVAQAFVP
ncbi:mannose-6-phosphate isomerase, class I [Arthrobacter sedimenti]|uniref:mannose-6-phosphate isomerase, class I n=1 Tax=Arthrobacter sedimenti TaxID=2694931 RepID=UPI000B34F0D5|nr:mannose-6-phosphate isomerase, class I [Arthrobacter sedimenti]OUM43482.1 mannose-6-phosphate isomerase, class I [Arthrobacter agilis]